MLSISINPSLNHSSSRDRLFSHDVLPAIPLFDPAAPAARSRGAATRYMPLTSTPLILIHVPGCSVTLVVHP